MNNLVMQKQHRAHRTRQVVRQDHTTKLGIRVYPLAIVLHIVIISPTVISSTAVRICIFKGLNEVEIIKRLLIRVIHESNLDYITSARYFI